MIVGLCDLDRTPSFARGTDVVHVLGELVERVSAR